MSRTVAAALYADVTPKVVVSFKFRGWDLLAAPLARRVASAVRANALDEGVDAVVPVPSTSSRNRERGYDPGELLASETARFLRLPLRPALVRTRATPPQSSLSATARRSNVKGAFRARPWTKGRTLLLVDDVMTTGATAFEAAATLRDAGATDVRVAVFARTPEPDGLRAPEPK